MRRASKGLVYIHSYFILFCTFCFIPLLLLISISFSQEIDIVKHGFKLIPINPTIKAYEAIFKCPQKVINAYKISVIVTGLGTAAGLLISSMLAYSISRSTFKFRNHIAFYIFFTMLFGGGLVPEYILITQYLNLGDNILVLMLPYLVLPFNIFILRTNFKKIPESLLESAKMDGASEYRIFFKIIIPLSTPVLATIGLFIALRYWNDWWLSLLYINDSKLYPLQMLLQTMMANIDAITGDMVDQIQMETFLQERELPRESIRMAMVLVAIGPIMFLFPFLQKYFVKGLTIGAIKG